MVETEKPHWIKLKQLLTEFENGRIILSFQDGLPILVEDIEGKRKQIDLTKNID